MLIVVNRRVIGRYLNIEYFYLDNIFIVGRYVINNKKYNIPLHNLLSANRTYIIVVLLIYDLVNML